jgi:hypothetical protein
MDGAVRRVVPPSAAGRRARRRPPLPISSVVRDAEPLPALRDTDVETGWLSEVGKGGRTALVVELPEPARVRGVALSLGRWVAQCPAYLRIAVSQNGSRWRSVWDGPPAREFFMAALEEPRAVRAAFRFRPTMARQVQIDLVATKATPYLALAEIEVLK